MQHTFFIGWRTTWAASEMGRYDQTLIIDIIAEMKVSLRKVLNLFKTKKPFE